MKRSASQLGVYETYEEFHGRKSTMDELIADVAQFSQQSMLWVCAVIIAGMQLWDRIDNQPAGVFDTLIKLYFDRPFHARLLAGFWGRQSKESAVSSPADPADCQALDQAWSKRKLRRESQRPK